MRTFDTPTPISIVIEVGVGHIGVAAGDRADATVDVKPSTPGKRADVAAAEQTRVDFANGTLSVIGPKGWRQFTSWSNRGSVDITIDVPTGSDLRGTAGVANLRATGRLGDCHFKSGVADIDLDETGPVELVTGSGQLSVGNATGHAVLTTASGAIRAGRIDGTAVVKNSNGDTSINAVTGELRVKAANGRVTVEHAEDDVVMKSANGDLRVGDVSRGTVVAHTAHGKVDVGVREGVAAWLDLSTQFGTVRNELDDGAPPAAGEATVEVRAQTAFGDITIRRATVGAH
jgi:DUF4097 and DUF4098 domain-containing protein YvlB